MVVIMYWHVGLAVAEADWLGLAQRSRRVVVVGVWKVGAIHML